MDIKNVEQCKTIYEGLKKNSFIVANIDKDFFLDFAETILNELDNKEKIINEMADELRDYYMDNLLDYRKITKKYVIQKFTKKAERK